MRVGSAQLSSDEMIKQLIRVVNGNIELLNNCSVKVVTVTGGLANTDIVISHGLGRVPQFYLYNIDRNGVVYDQARATWSATTMTLRCSTANAVIKLMVF